MRYYARNPALCLPSVRSGAFLHFARNWENLLRYTDRVGFIQKALRFAGKRHSNRQEA